MEFLRTPIWKDTLVLLRSHGCVGDPKKQRIENNMALDELNPGSPTKFLSYLAPFVVRAIGPDIGERPTLRELRKSLAWPAETRAGRPIRRPGWPGWWVGQMRRWSDLRYSP